MSRTNLLQGKVALITGAASGQGRAASVLFAGHGARIAVIDINDAGAAETVDLVVSARAAGQRVTAEVCPHHLLLDLDDYARLGPWGCCAPPLRSNRAATSACRHGAGSPATRAPGSRKPGWS